MGLSIPPSKFTSKECASHDYNVQSKPDLQLTVLLSLNKSWCTSINLQRLRKCYNERRLEKMGLNISGYCIHSVVRCQIQYTQKEYRIICIRTCGAILFLDMLLGLANWQASCLRIFLVKYRQCNVYTGWKGGSNIFGYIILLWYSKRIRMR